jgi:hypothetical protein
VLISGADNSPSKLQLYSGISRACQSRIQKKSSKSLFPNFKNIKFQKPPLIYLKLVHLGTDAILLDNGLSTGLEQHTYRRNVKLIAVSPEALTHLPDNSQPADPEKDISQNHTHVFLTTD